MSSVPSPNFDKRSTARAWFYKLPTTWVSHDDGTFEARCLNVSKGVVALDFGPDFTGAAAGDLLTTALVAPRQSLTVEGVVVTTRRSADKWQVLVSFTEQPKKLTDLIEAALSCTDREFAAGSVTASGARVSLRGWLSRGLAGDIEHIARTCRIIDMADVRNIDLDGLSALADAREHFGVTIANCNERVARIVRDNYGRSLCAADCRTCPAEVAASALVARAIH